MGDVLCDMLHGVIILNSLFDGHLLVPCSLLVLNNFLFNWDVLNCLNGFVLYDCSLIGNVFESSGACVIGWVPWISLTPSVMKTARDASGTVKAAPDCLSEKTGPEGTVEAGFWSEALILKIIMEINGF